MKVVKNVCYGGFGLSPLALMRLSNITGKTIEECIGDYDFALDEDRALPELVQVVEELGTLANGESAKLEIVEVPDDVDWYIDDYDGWETIVEVHGSW